MAERTLPTDGMSPCDFYDSVAPTRALGHFQWDLSGSSAPAADACVLLDINDATTIASGTITGLSINYAASGTKTGGTVQALGIDMIITANTTYAYGMNVYTSDAGDYTMEILTAFNIYMEDPGTAVSRYFAFNVGMDNDSAPAGESGMLRFRNHGSRSLDCIFQIEASNSANHLFNLTKASLPYHSANVSVQDGKIAIKVQGTTKWLQLYAS